jgi:four helix bundle protein
MYRKLDVWKKAYSLGLEIYKQTNYFPKEELFGITSQIRRSATSIAVNIAEGNSRNSSKEFKQFLSIARGSAAEVETWLMFSRDLNYISQNEFIHLSKRLDEIKALLFALYKAKSA